MMKSEIVSLLSEPLLISKAGLQHILSLQDFSQTAPKASEFIGSSDNLCILAVSGIMSRYENRLTQLGLGTATATLKANIAKALSKNQHVLLVFDTDGGVVDGMSDIAEYVYANRACITGFVAGTAASAGLWLASQCGKLYAENTSLLGSVGTAVSYIDDSELLASLGVKKIELTSSKSPNKRADLSTEAGKASVVELLDELSESFILSVAKARGVSDEYVIKSFKNGGMITGKSAVKLGMIDGVGSLNELILNLNKGASMPKAEKVDLGAVNATENLVKSEQVATAISEPSASVNNDTSKIISAQEAKIAKLEALATYRGLLSDADYTALKDDESISASGVKDFILNAKIAATPPMQVKVGEDIARNSISADVGDAIAIIAGASDGKDASNRANSLAGRGLKSLVATYGGLGVSASNDELMRSMTTTDFPMLLKSSLKRVLDVEFERAETTFEQITNLVAFPDFREYTKVNRGAVPSAVWDNELVEGGEVRGFSLKEAARSAKLQSYGAKFNITRQMLINDDLGAFLGLVSDYVAAAKYFVNESVYALLETRGKYKNYKMNDNKPLFDEAHKNLIKGTSSVLSEASLSVARTAMMRQTDGNGNSIRVTPKHLIVPAELLDTATRLLVSPATLELNQNSGVKNIYQGAYSIITDPEIENTTAWYLAAPKCINVGYLRANGGVAPVIELAKQNIIDGLEYHGILDFVVYADRYQNVLKSTGVN